MTILKVFLSLLLLFLLTIACKKGCQDDSNCKLKPDPGNCEALIPKYYYDQEKKRCMEFIWGGCEGTVPFETMQECRKCKCYK